MNMGNTGAQISSTELVSRVNKGILSSLTLESLWLPVPVTLLLNLMINTLP